MSKINNFVNKIGNDKALHFLFGALIVSYGNQISILFGIISFITIMLLEFYKEYRIDKFVDFKDIMATLYGCIFSEVISLIIKYFSVFIK